MSFPLVGDDRGRDFSTSVERTSTISKIVNIGKKNICFVHLMEIDISDMDMISVDDNQATTGGHCFYR